MKIVIENAEYEIKYSLRMYYIYESITGKAFEGNTIFSLSLLFFSALLANNKEFPYDFDQFVDVLDKDETPLNLFSEWFLSEMGKRAPDTDKKKAQKGV